MNPCPRQAVRKSRGPEMLILPRSPPSSSQHTHVGQQNASARSDPSTEPERPRGTTCTQTERPKLTTALGPSHRGKTPSCTQRRLNASANIQTKESGDLCFVLFAAASITSSAPVFQFQCFKSRRKTSLSLPPLMEGLLFLGVVEGWVSLLFLSVPSLAKRRTTWCKSAPESEILVAVNLQKTRRVSRGR